MKKLIFLILICQVYSFTGNAQNSFPVFQWAERMGGQNSDVIKKVTTDDHGNVYVIGEFKETIHFNTMDYTSLGGSDVFIAKYNADGTPLWITTIGGTGDDLGEDISFKTYAGSSLLLICGSGTGTMVFSPPYASSFTRVAQGDRDYFIGLLNTGSGNIIAQMSGCTNTGTNSSKEAFGAAFDNTTGQIFVTGYIRCSGTDLFGNVILPDNGGGKCFFFAKYDSNLSFSKVRFAPKNAANFGESSGPGIYVAPAGNGIQGMVSVCGYYQGQVEFAQESPGLASTPLLSNFNPQGFWVLFDPNDPKCFDAKFAPFNLGYSFDGSGPFGYVIPTGILIAPNTNLYVTGYYNNNVTIGGINLNSSGANDAFVSRLDFTAPYGSTYTYWLNRIGNTGQDQGHGLALSVNGSNLFVTGGFSGTLSFSGNTISSQGDGDIFIAKYNAADGTGNWITRLGGKYDDEGLGIAVNADNDIYIGGRFEDSVSVNGGFMISGGNADGFTGKLKDLVPITVTPANRMCIGQSFTINYSSSETYLSDNIFNVQLSDDLGNFGNAVTIGSVSSTVSGSITVSIPSSIPPGNGYRVRVVSTDPVNNGNNSAEAVAPLTISAQSNSPVCIGDAIQLSLLPTPVSALWLGVTSPFSSTQISPVIPNASLIFSGHYQVTYIDSLGCHGISGTDVDIDPGITYHRDNDGDGYGNVNLTIQSCSGAPAGYVLNATDCNDNNAAIHPGAAETCNGSDDNCDGSFDDGISGAEYFFDIDPGTGNGFAITNFSMNNPVTINYHVTLSGRGLSAGNHKIFIRIKDICGQWSLYEAQSFYIIPEIVAAEYFFDADPGVRNGIPLTGFTSNNVVSINASLPLGNYGLSPGSHKIFLRVKDSIGQWSLYDGQNFYVSPSIDMAEYFFDTDHGTGGNGTVRFNITNPADIISQVKNISYSGLPVGQHRLYMRVHDNTGRWSLYDNQIFTVKNCNPVAAISPSGNPVLCSGSQLTANSGTAYKWLPNGETTQSITVTSAGDYSVEVYDIAGTGCSAIASTTIIVIPPPTATINGTTTVCLNSSSPSVSFTGSNGVAPYTFTYNINGGLNLMANSTSGNSASVAAPTGTPGASVYTLVNVTDASGCSQLQSGSATVTVNPNPSPLISISGPVNCTLTLDAGDQLTNEYSLYNWNWNTGATTQSIHVNAQAGGIYSVIMTNQYGCTATTSVSPPVYRALVPFISISGPANCSLTLDAGDHPTQDYSLYNWSWNTGATTQTIHVDAQAGGIYSVSITNEYGCTATASVNPPVYRAVVPFISLSGPANCSLTLDAGDQLTQDYSLYNWSWNTGATTQTIHVDAQAGGIYSVIMTNEYGCTATASVSPPAYRALVPFISISGPANCSLTLDAGDHLTQDYSLYNWSWNTGATTQTIHVDAQAGGIYSVSITNEYGCTATASVSPPAYRALVPFISISGPANCSLTLDAGDHLTQDYSLYNWSWNTGATTQTIHVDAQAGGIYSVIITNEYGCTATASVSPQVYHAVVPFISLSGPANCTLTLDAGDHLTNDYSLYGWSWNTGATTQTIHVDAQAGGIYSVSMTNEYGCTGTALQTVTVNPLPTAVISGSTSVCLNSATPDISFTGITGVEPYTFTYNINGGQNLTATTSSGSALTVTAPTGTAGIFVYNLVSVSDNTGCVQALNSTVTIAVNPSPVWYKDSDHDLYSDGTTTTGCTQPSGYYPASSLLATIGDCNDANPAIHPGAMEVCGNNIDDNCNGQVDETCCTLALAVTRIGNACPGTSSGSVAISVHSGTQPIAFLWNNGSRAQNLTAVPSGIYTVTATDANGCTQTLTAQVSEYPATHVSFTGLPANICQNSSPVTLTGIPSGGIFDGIGIINNTFNPVGLSGQHSVLYFYRDVNGCSNADLQFTSVSRAFPDPVDVITTDNNFCEGSMVTLTAITLDGIPNVNQPELVWYEGGCGSGASVGNGTSITLIPSGGIHNYYVRAEGACNITNCTSETITVGTTVQEPSSISCSAGTNFCAGTEITLTVNGGSLGDGAAWIWSEGNCTTGTPLNSSSDAVTFTPSAGTHTYFVKGQGLCNTTSCISITLTAIPPNVAAGQISIDASPVCQDISFNLSVNTSSGGFLNAGSQWTWYEGGCGNGAPIGTGSQISVTSTITGSHIYSVRAEGQCNTTVCTRGLIKIYAQNQPPSIVLTSNSTLCDGNSSATISIADGFLSPGAQWKWYEGGCGNASPVGTGSSIVVTPGTSGIHSYYIRAEGGCGNTICKSVDVNVDAAAYFKRLYGKIAPPMIQNTTYNGIANIIPASDGGYVFCGRIDMNFISHFWIVKIDAYGNLSWEKKYGGSYSDDASDIIQTSDGGYLIAGGTSSNDGDVNLNHGGTDGWVIKLNSIGNIVWKKCYGGSNYDVLQHITPIKNGGNDLGYILCGYSKSSNGDLPGNRGNSDAWVIKIDIAGNLIWSMNCGGSKAEEAHSSCLKSNGDLLITGYTNSNNGDVSGNHSGGADIWVMDINSSGILQWQKCYGGSADDRSYCIINNGNDEFYISGDTKSNNGDFPSASSGARIQDLCLIKISSNGNLLFNRTFNNIGSLAQNSGVSQIVLKNNKIYLVSTAISNTGDVTGLHGGNRFHDIWLAEFDLNGNLTHQQCFGGSNYDFSSSVNVTDDGGLIIGGTTTSWDGDLSSSGNNNGSYEGWVIKIGPEGYRYEDHDQDSYGNPYHYLPACQAPVDWISDNTDCNDNDPNAGGIPMLAGEITGPASMCSGVQSLSYTITEVPNAISYNWTLPAGMSIRGAAHNNAINVKTNASFHGGEIAVEVYNTCNNRLYRSFNIVATDVPVQPGPISGNENICPGSTESYSITPVSGLTYQWTAPRNATIVSANGSPTVSIQFNSVFTGGKVRVVALNNCGPSNETNLQVDKVSRPTAPNPINGIWSICVNTSVTFSVSPVANATSYLWTAPVNSTVISGQGTTEVTIQFADNFTLGDLTVYTSNCTGTSPTTTKHLRKNNPPSPTIKPELILNNFDPRPYEVCIVHPYTYTVSPIQYATDYTWITPANTVIMNGQGTTAVQIQYLSGFIEGEIRVVASNCNGNTDTAHWTFRSTTPDPSGITGPLNEACAGSTQTFTAVNGRGCNWVVYGATLVSGQGSPTIQVSFPSNFTQATISVQNIDHCGATPFLSQTVYQIPPISGISGLTTTYGFCGGGNNIPFSVVPVQSAISYTWSIPTGMTLIRGQGTANIVTNIASSFTARDLCVYATNVCGNGIQKCFRINTVPDKPIFNLSGSQALCPGTISQYSVGNVTSAISYTWTVPPGWTIRSGQGSRSISVLAGTAGGILQVVANNSCGSSEPAQRSLSVLTSCKTAEEQLVTPDQNFELNIFPNPAVNEASIVFNTSAATNYKLEIIDMTGRVLIRKEAISTEGDNLINVGLSKFSNGVYFVRLILYLDKPREIKFVKQ